MSKSEIPRYSTRYDIRYHKADRAKNKIILNTWKYDELPSKESMRKAIWRGNNCFGDLTSFGDFNSRDFKYSLLTKLLDKHVGKSYDEYYSKMCKKFRGYDRHRFEIFLFWEFNNRYFFGRDYTRYTVVNGLIVKK